jgi:hypothetical protein
MVKKVIIGIVAIIGGLCAYAAFQKPDYNIYREVAVNAPAEKVPRASFAGAWKAKTASSGAS